MLACMAAAVFCFLKRQKKKKSEEKTEIIHVDEHRKVKEMTVDGPDGPKAVVLEMEDDVHVDERIVTKDELRKGFHARENEHLPAPSSSTDHKH